MIKFELPDDNSSVLYHIGGALRKIAEDLDGKPSKHRYTTEVDDHVHTTPTNTPPLLVQQIGRAQRNTSPEVETDTVSEQYASLAKDGVVKREGPFYWSHPESDSYGMVDTEAELIEAVTPEYAFEITEEEYNALSDAHGDNPTDVDVTPPPPVDEPTDPKSTTATDVKEKDESVVDHVVGVETDTNGLPWDKRIHSDTRNTNGDGSWRNRRRPKEEYPTDEEWKEYIKSIEAELRAAMGGQTDNTPPPPPVTTLGDAAYQSEISGASIDDTPPPPVEEPTPFDQAVTQDVPPPPSSDNLEPKTFPELMKLITGNAKEKGAVAKVQQIITEHNYGSLQTLSSVGAEAVTTVYHELKAKL